MALSVKHESWQDDCCILSRISTATRTRTQNAGLGRPDGPRLNVAAPSTPTCRNCHTSNMEAKTPGGCHDNLLLATSLHQNLTSGYYVGKKYVFHLLGPSVYQEEGKGNKPKADTLTRTAQNQGKCSHGGLLDRSRYTTANGGINNCKDTASPLASPHWYLHKKLEAADVAVQATINFLEGVRKEVGNPLFLRFLGLDYDASLSFSIDTSKSMFYVIPAVKDAVHNIIHSRLAGGSVPSEFVLAEFNDPCKIDYSSLTYKH